MYYGTNDEEAYIIWLIPQNRIYTLFMIIYNIDKKYIFIYENITSDQKLANKSIGERIGNIRS